MYGVKLVIHTNTVAIECYLYIVVRVIATTLVYVIAAAHKCDFNEFVLWICSGTT